VRKPNTTRAPTKGVRRIAAERQRQIESEGWTPEHDNTHHRDQLAWAAVCYAAPAAIRREARHPNRTVFLDPWPWSTKWDKRGRTDRVRDLEKAGALIAAEIDRLLRLEEKEETAPGAPRIFPPETTE